MSIDRLGNKLFQLLLKYENIKSRNKPFLKDIIRGKLKVNDGKINIKTDCGSWDSFGEHEHINTHEEKIIIEVINFFNNLSETFDDIFSGIPDYFGLTVFFMPGTDIATPIFYGKWAKTSKDDINYLNKYSLYYKNHFFDIEDNNGRIDKVSMDLRHLKYPLYDKITISEPIDLPKDEIDIDHFFFWIKALIDLKYISGYEITGSNVLYVNGDGFILEYDYGENSERPYYKLRHNDGSTITVYWKANDKWQENKMGKQPSMLFNPIYINHDTFVLVVTFLTSPIQKQEKLDNINQLKAVHKLFSSSIFDCIYNAILRENNQVIFDNLQRGFISKSLLDNSSENLDSKSKFTFKWFELIETGKARDTDKPLYCADLRSFIYGDYYKNPQDIFKLILDVEKFIFVELKKDFSTSSALINTTLLPQELPNSLVLKNIELTQRSLSMYDRDHIVHQFQVFLLGTNLINEYYDRFINSFKDCIEREIKGISLSQPEILSLLKFSWFFTSVNHDIGYPIQKIDNVLKELRDNVCSLPNISTEYIKGMPKFKINFSQILYDDPRSYIILKEIAYKVSTFDRSNLDTEDKKQRWWYLIRYLTFEKKRHELMSVLSLGLHFVNESHKKIESFIYSDYGKFIINFILLPITLHHFHVWDDDGQDIPKPGNYKDKRTFFTNNLPKKGKLKVDFDENPIAILLLFCDSWQEEGRPSGDKKEAWANSCTEELDLTKKEYKLVFHYTHSRSETQKKCEEDLIAKIKKVKPLFNTLLGLGPLSSFNVKMTGDYRFPNNYVEEFDLSKINGVNLDELKIEPKESILK